MLDAARNARKYVGDLSREQYLSEGKEITRLAVERLLQILGEAARRVSPEFREAHPEIPWGDIVGLRKVISHLYDRVDYTLIHDIVTMRIPPLLADLEPLVPLPPESPDEA